MAKPIVAIVGRPNVGKSTLFNRLVGRRKAIVVETPGATRDRNYGEFTWRGRSLIAVDTGGFEPWAKEGLSVQVREQAQLAIDEADVIFLLLDGQSGWTPDDQDLVDMLRRSGKPFVVAVNKVDGPRHEKRVYDFYALGVEKIYPISAEHGKGVGELLDAVLEEVPSYVEEELEEGAIRFAVIGRPNVGKSSLINKLLGMERCLVSEIPGTTRDAIDTRLEYEGCTFIAIDTAGIRRKARVREKVEAYSILRALRSLERCDVACLLIDAFEGLTEQDIRIAGYVEEAGRGLVIAVNKWDLIEDSSTGSWLQLIRDRMPFVAHAPVLFISALTGKHVQRLLPAVASVAEQHRRRVPTPELNRLLEEAVKRHHPPVYRGRQVKIFYGAQIGTCPPTFALVTNYPEAIGPSYQRYLINRLREAFGFEGTPLKIRLRKRRRGKELSSTNKQVLRARKP